MKKEYIFAATSIMLWSTVAVITKLLLGEVNNFQLLWISVFFAGLFLLILNICTGKIKKLKNYSLKDFLTCILTGIPGTFLYYVFYYAGADMLLASQAFVINYLWPIMSVVFACIILKEKMSFKKAIAIIMSFVGVIIVVGGELVNLNNNIIGGAACCAMGAVSYGIFTALNQKSNYDKPLSMMISYFTTFIFTTVINGVCGDLFIPSPVQILGFAWNGMFTMGIASTVWIMALESGKTAKISNLAYITPFLSLIWTALVLNEPVTVNSVAGLVVIVSGILIQLKK